MVKKIVDVSVLSTKEKLQAMEELWNSLQSDEIKSPEWHNKIIDERVAKIKKGTATYMSIDELKSKFQ